METKKYKHSGNTLQVIEGDIKKAQDTWALESLRETLEKKKVRGKMPFLPKASDYETPKGKSKTIQDDSYSIQEILEKYVQGMPISAKKGAVYLSGDEEQELDAIDLEKLSRSDFGEQFRTNVEHLEKIRHVRNEQEKAKKSKKAEKKEGEE